MDMSCPVRLLFPTLFCRHQDVDSAREVMIQMLRFILTVEGRAHYVVYIVWDQEFRGGFVEICMLLILERKRFEMGGRGTGSPRNV